MKKILIINGITIRQNENGLFSLVDLCKAGGKKSATSFINSMCSVQKCNRYNQAVLICQKSILLNKTRGLLFVKNW